MSAELHTPHCGGSVARTQRTSIDSFPLDQVKNKVRKLLAAAGMYFPHSLGLLSATFKAGRQSGRWVQYLNPPPHMQMAQFQETLTAQLVTFSCFAL